jgi:hypothetical protein
MKSIEGAEGQNGAFSGQSAPRGRGAVSYIENALSAAPTDPREGQSITAESEPIRILLSKAASDALTASGEKAFAIVHRVMRSEEPETAGRWAIYLAPVAWPTATAATAVLCGKARAVKVKAPRP